MTAAELRELGACEAVVRAAEDGRCPNDEQLEAILHTEGALLVLAGPGTGKTQLLSLRTAQILETCDVSPENVLCLTFTDAGAEEMRRRLVSLVGRDGYGVEVGTFHAFTTRLRQLYPEYFTRPASDTLVTDTHRSEIIEGLLNGLRVGDPLYAKPTDVSDDSAHRNLRNVRDLFECIEKSGATVDELRSALGQTKEVLELLQDALADGSLTVPDVRKGKAEEKARAIAGFCGDVRSFVDSLPPELREPAIGTPGVMEPYTDVLLRAFPEGGEGLFEGDKTDGFQAARKAVLKQDEKKKWRLAKDLKRTDAALEALDLYEKYRERLASEHLYTYQDMIDDAAHAMEDNPEFLIRLQEQYRYIQVDEFQDTNGSQMHIVDLLCGGGHPNLMCVGDDDQAIMRFQGADVTFLQQFRDRYGAKVIPLTENYRSRPALVGLGQHVVRQIGRRVDPKRELEAVKKDVPMVFSAHEYQSQELEYAALAKDVAEKAAAWKSDGGDPKRRIAVIARKHKTLAAVAMQLHALGVSFQYEYSDRLDTMGPLQTLLAALRAVTAIAEGRPEFADEWIAQVVASPEIGLDTDTCIDLAFAAENRKRELRRSGKHRSAWAEALRSCDDEAARGLGSRLNKAAARAKGVPAREIVADIASDLAPYWRGRQEEDALGYAGFESGVRVLLDFARGESALADGPLLLTDAMAAFERARHLQVRIGVNVPIGSGSQVVLTTAHGSKGAEYEYVCLADADEKSWKTDERNSPIVPPNALFAGGADPDDDLRLMFVAVTRAKEGLSFWLGRGSLAAALSGSVGEVPEGQSVEPDAVGEAERVGWEGRLQLSPEELVGALGPGTGWLRLSASLLNRFVTWEGGCANSTAVLRERVLRLPERPSFAREYGTLVHSMMEDHARAMARGDADRGALEETYLLRLRRMDFADDVVAAHEEVFERTADRALRWLERLASENPGARILPEVGSRPVVDGVPLTGYCDLILADDDRRELRIFDYKTGRDHTDEKPDAKYMRQLRFYRLLLESDPAWEGWHVVGIANVYIEPDKDLQPGKDGRLPLPRPVEYTASDEEVAEVRELARAVWARIESGRFDTSAFEQTDDYRLLSGKRGSRPAIQAAYERWLVATA